MKQYIVFFITIILTLPVIAQQRNQQDVISSAGSFDSAPGISLSWTLGETFIPTFHSSDIIVSHGFQQQLVVTVVGEEIEFLADVTVYPNPASDIIKIRFATPPEECISLSLFNSGGKLIITDFIEAFIPEKHLDMHDLSAGIYYLKLTGGALSNIYKVVKL
ncbi:MAG TPA: T9SS type A sorting domain-containing protein [Bacteroidales bacterium]|nr:T9SS type A sorting domain-containing protein [Bacteroidales bacterium]HPI67989.1 T9SS type A sorting domain-containing protein [Bacteroidales bacterium]HPR72434.1 T9SS type A sorting domain-containing protein [Bacteroidales bacterium]